MVVLCAHEDKILSVAVALEHGTASLVFVPRTAPGTDAHTSIIYVVSVVHVADRILLAEKLRC